MTDDPGPTARDASRHPSQDPFRPSRPDPSPLPSPDPPAPVGEPEIRRASAADLDALVELRIAMDRELTGGIDPAREADHRAAYERYLGTDVASGDLVVFVAAAPDGTLVSTGAIRVVHRAPHPRSRRLGECQLTGVYTVPAWRGRGLARRIVAACIGEARERKVRRVWLRTSAAGRQVYAGMGFTDPGYYLQLDLD